MFKTQKSYYKQEINLPKIKNKLFFSLNSYLKAIISSNFHSIIKRKSSMSS